MTTTGVQIRRAIELSAADLGATITVRDHHEKLHIGCLDRIELSADPRTRVVLWLSDGNSRHDYFVNRDAIVIVGSAESS